MTSHPTTSDDCLQEPDPAIDEYNKALEHQPDVIAYRDAKRNGSLEAALGLPVKQLRQIQQLRYGTIGGKHFEGSPPITFYVHDRKGILLHDALRKDFSGLRDANTSTWLSGTSAKVNIRCRVDLENDLEKKGGEFHHAIPSRRATVEAEPLALSVIAHHVAKLVQTHMEKAANGLRWRLVGNYEISFDEILLLELRHVSEGSWQPVFGFHDSLSI